MQILLFLAVGFLVVFFIYAKKSTLSKKVKVALLVVLACVIGLAWWYEVQTESNSEHNRLLISAFKQGKTLYCGDKEISATTFVFVSGTLSFIANDKNQNDKGVVIDMATCRLEH